MLQLKKIIKIIRCVYALYILNKCKCLIIHMHFLVNTYFYIV